MRTIKILLVILLLVTTGLFGITTIHQRTSGVRVRPEIRCDQTTLEISVQQPEADLLVGLTATDEQDGDLTDQIMVAGISKLISQDTAKVTYLVFDSDNNVASCTRQIRYTDYHRPILEVTAPLSFTAESSSAILQNLRAADVLDGDISSAIRISTLSDTADSNVLAVVVQVTNSLGDTSRVKLPVIIMDSDPSRPVITLREQLIYLEQGSRFDPADYLRSVTQAGHSLSTEDIAIENPVDTTTPGTYWVYYRYASDGSTGLAVLTVIVQ